MSLDTIKILREVMERSPYYELFLRNISVIGFDLGNGDVLIFTREKNQVSIEKATVVTCLNAELWVELDPGQLYDLASKGMPVTKLKIYTGKRGQVLDPKVETIIQRMFMSSKNKKYPIEDLIDLVYGGMFGFKESTVVWRSQKKFLEVLRYKEVQDDIDVYITYGFTNPRLSFSSAQCDKGKLSGYGYELMIFAKQDDVEIIREFIDWVRYIDDTDSQIYQGQYLEYGKGIKLPNTNVAGFIVLKPWGFPETIPVADGYATLNLLMGATEEELQVAKQKDIYIIAERLKEAGYINYAPKNRMSII